MTFTFEIIRNPAVWTSAAVPHLHQRCNYVVTEHASAVETIAEHLGRAAQQRTTINYESLARGVTLADASAIATRRLIRCEAGEILMSADRKVVDDIVIHLTIQSYAAAKLIAAALVATNRKPSPAYVDFRKAIDGYFLVRNWSYDLEHIYRYFKSIGR